MPRKVEQNIHQYFTYLVEEDWIIAGHLVISHCSKLDVNDSSIVNQDL